MTSITATGLPMQQISSLPNTWHRYQAEQFLDWFRRRPDSITITVAFREWIASKDFGFADQKAIAKDVLALLDSAIDGPFDSKVSLGLDDIIVAIEEGRP